MKASTFALLFIPGTIALITVLVVSGSYESPPTKQSESDPRELACIAGQIAVKQKLTDPSIAAFHSCIGADGVTDDGQNRYLARSVFETPYASGIKRQHGYAVSVTLGEKTFKTFVIRID